MNTVSKDWKIYRLVQQKVATLSIFRKDCFVENCQDRLTKIKFPLAVTVTISNFSNGITEHVSNERYFHKVFILLAIFA